MRSRLAQSHGWPVCHHKDRVCAAEQKLVRGWFSVGLAPAGTQWKGYQRNEIASPSFRSLAEGERSCRSDRGEPGGSVAHGSIFHRGITSLLRNESQIDISKCGQFRVTESPRRLPSHKSTCSLWQRATFRLLLKFRFPLGWGACRMSDKILHSQTSNLVHRCIREWRDL